MPEFKELLPGDTVHILDRGLPLCRFRTDVPMFWPGGHFWVGVEDAAVATCPTCVKRALGD